MHLQVPDMSPEDAHLAINTAHEAQRSWAALTAKVGASDAVSFPCDLGTRLETWEQGCNKYIQNATA